MRAEHNSGPENGPQKSVTTDLIPRNSQTEPDGHACPINRNSNARCRAWEVGGLIPALRCFAEHHNWHEPGPLTNRLKLRALFDQEADSSPQGYSLAAVTRAIKIVI